MDKDKAADVVYNLFVLTTRVFWLVVTMHFVLKYW